MNDGLTAAQRSQEEKEIRERDLRRQQEREEAQRRLEEQKAEEERRRQEEEQRRLEEIKRRKKAEAEWKKLGNDVIQDLPPVPPPITDKGTHIIEAWYLNEETSKPNLCTNSLKPGRKSDSPNVTLKDLRELGVVFFNVNLNDLSIVKQIVKERNYKHTDEIRASQTEKDDTFLERWFQEHYNEDEQLRLITEGSCYMDIRSTQDAWIRVLLKVGDLIILPPGMYHRGTLDEDDFVGMFRGLRDAPRFVPVNRSDSRADSNKVRLTYLMNLKKGDVATEMGFR